MSICNVTESGPRQYPKGNYPGWCVDALAAVGVHLPPPPAGEVSLQAPLGGWVLGGVGGPAGGRAT